jgi:S-DNA-T family DNA segregation ATPase FtsK/SpoIIIE
VKSLKLTLRPVQGGPGVDLALTMEPGLTVGALANALAVRDPHQRGHSGEPLTLALQSAAGSVTLAAVDQVETSGIHSGATVSLLPASVHFDRDQPRQQAGLLEILAGPGSPRSVPLYHGVNTIGRDPECTVALPDPQISKRHARIVIDSYVEILDDDSTNGVVIGGGPVTRKVITGTDRITLGDTIVSVQAAPSTLARSGGGQGRRGVVPFNRSPRLDPPYAGLELEAPALPQRPQPRRLPIVPMMMPILMGAMLYAFTRSPYSLVFVAMSPLMLLGSYFEEKSVQRGAFRQAVADFRAALATLNADLLSAQEKETAQRKRAHPAIGELVRDATGYGQLLWTRRPEHESFLDLRLGSGDLPSRNTVKLPTGAERNSPLFGELKALIESYETVAAVPVVARLSECGALGIAGHDARARQVAWSVLAQLVTLHSSAEVIVTAAMSSASAAHWEWLKWLPHTSPHPISQHTPLRAPHLTTGGDGATRLIAELDNLISQRAGQKTPLPIIVVLVSDDTDVERALLVDIAERGPAAGVHVIWCAPTVQRLPAACRTFLIVTPDGTQGNAGFVQTGDEVAPLTIEPLSEQDVHALARRLAPVVDAGARIDDESGLPATVSLIGIASKPIDSSAQAILDRWGESRSIATGPYAVAPDRRHEPHLRALIGAVGVDEPFHLDLRSQGPHALVGGITGAGKSELLQSWLLGIAMAHSPQRATFLLVDYKGGSAFGACSQLPHCIGLVTDLNPHLVQRALTSLRAELTYREELINHHQVKDLVELEKESPAQAVPRLIIVVDEFAALKKEIPEFVDGLVDIAQRGRSLGLHLILATQRPAGVISENLRANTNLRVALRMADEADSSDVLGVPLAAGFDPDIPGRAAARTGPGRLVTFQAAYAGGWTTSEPPPPRLVVSPLPFGLDKPWDQPVPAIATGGRDRGPNDVSRIVSTIRRAFELVQVRWPRKPWLPELPAELKLGDLLETARREPGLVFGRCDLPASQAQPSASFDPDKRGNLIVYGAGGTGKSTFLRTLAAAAAQGQAGPVHLYGIDAGGRGLEMLEALPHNAPIIRADDTERVTRLLDRLGTLIEQRSETFSRFQAASIADFWRLSGADSGDNHWQHPRILLLIDGATAFFSHYQQGVTFGVFERLLSVMTAGRKAGVHVLLTADRTTGIPGSITAAVQSRVVLRLASEYDYTSLGLRSNAIDAAAPPGRGLMGKNEIQVAVPGGHDLATQVEWFAKLGANSPGVPAAPAVRVLGTQIPLSSLATRAGDPVIGVDSATLEPITFRPSGFFVVSGPSGSGQTSTLRSLAMSLRSWRPAIRLVLLAKQPSALPEVLLWTHHATDVLGALTQVRQLVKDEEGPVAIVLESVANFATDPAMPELVTACTESNVFVVAEGDPSAILGYSPALQTLRSHRTGLALQPSLSHGQVFGVDMNKMPRPAHPPAGRAVLFDRGNGRLIQIALPQ